MFSQDGVIEGVLYDTNGAEDIVINDHLAINGYASFVLLNEEDESSLQQNSYGDKDELLDTSLHSSKHSLDKVGVIYFCYFLYIVHISISLI